MCFGVLGNYLLSPAHTLLLVCNFLANNNTVIMPQLLYSLDLALCAFFLFPKLKRPMKGRRCATIEEALKTPKSAYQKCCENWEKRWQSVLYLKRTIQILMNKYIFFKKNKNSTYFLNSLRTHLNSQKLSVYLVMFLGDHYFHYLQPVHLPPNCMGLLLQVEFQTVQTY